jgi:hypothetical protein
VPRWIEHGREGSPAEFVAHPRAAKLRFNNFLPPIYYRNILSKRTSVQLYLGGLTKS